jgi:hypothetical protein
MQAAPVYVLTYAMSFLQHPCDPIAFAQFIAGQEEVIGIAMNTLVPPGYTIISVVVTSVSSLISECHHYHMIVWMSE